MIRLSTSVLLLALLCTACKTQLTVDSDLACVRFNALLLRSAEEKELAQDIEALAGTSTSSDWLRDVTVCDVGQYRLYIPAKGDSDHVWLISDESFTIQLSRGHLSISEHRLREIISLTDENMDGVADLIRYHPRPREADADVEIWDRELDGCPDVKIVQGADRSRVTKVLFAGKWAELTEKDGEWGWILDGVFHSSRISQGSAHDRR
jgi:hypothetical protein